jgi:cell wall-associated NlpC family hydrolase
MLISLIRLSPWLLALLLPLGLTQCNVVKDPSVLARPVPVRTPAKVGGKEEGLRRDIVDYARRFEGKNYLAGGKNPQTGFDCSGFTSYVMKNFKIMLSASARDQVNQGRSTAVTSARPGDLVFFRRGPGQPIFHVALVVANTGKTLSVIHSTSSRGVVVDDIMKSAYWKPKIDSVREVVK